MKPRIIYIHGNDTSHWSFGWAGWLKGELEKSGFPTFFETFPYSVLARSKYWLPFIKEYIKAGKNDVIVGWSSGAVAAMRYAQNNEILGSVLIGPSYSDFGDELEKQSGYYDIPWDWEVIKNNQKNIALFYGDDDPFISQREFEFIGEKLNPQVYKIAGAKHFIEYKKFPELSEYLNKIYS